MNNISFNINETVKVQLTETGQKIYRTVYNKNPKVDKDGYTEFQLWHLMQLFGNYMINGSNDLPFSTNIIIIKPDEYDDWTKDELEFTLKSAFQHDEVMTYLDCSNNSKENKEQMIKWATDMGYYASIDDDNPAIVIVRRK